ncbi:GPD1 [Cordylochernes scorpioides]|uniref:Glycerol-3-phosphate dehydrogenase [NAD(+)] n=1 Tax=Cordylochernes scorpioides TaxID=51811 RepID=A0ABY6KTN3_9ARAC|nr:GPD1 [Cordylochernes scorpioides]
MAPDSYKSPNPPVSESNQTGLWHILSLKETFCVFQVAIPDVYQTAHDADILVFVLPHKFIRGACEPLKGKIREGAIGISLVKGFDIGPDGGVALISDVIHESLGIPMCVLMGANLAPEVAAGNFCETTIGCEDPQLGRLLKTLIETDYFRVTVVKDVKTVELCGALKNIVACGAGFVDGLQLGDNTKAAVIRIGLVEMMSYAETFFPGACKETFFESCGVADLITTCYGGRNRRIAEAFVKTKKSIQDLEKEMLNGMKSQGPQTAEEVYVLLKSKSMLEKFPLFVAIHRICIGELPPEELIRCLQDHPAHHHSHL